MSLSNTDTITLLIALRSTTRRGERRATMLIAITCCGAGPRPRTTC